MDSKASFKKRAEEIGMDDTLLGDMIGKGLDSYSKLAYVCAANPTSGDDTKLKKAVEDLINYHLSDHQMIAVRQMWFESYTIAMTELEERVKKTPNDVPKSLPLAERMARIEQQKKKLTGLVIDQYMEPAHSLVDKVHSMLDDGVLTYVGPEKCPSRHDEIQGQKTEQHVVFDSMGNLKINKKAADLSCDVSGELKLRQALTRRALSFDQAGLCSFEVMEAWHNQMMNTTMRAPPNGHRYVSLNQVINADKEMWGFLSQDTRGNLRPAVGAQPPLDKQLKELTTSPQVLCFMTPLPGGSNGSDNKPKAVPKQGPKPPSPGQHTPRNGEKSKQRRTSSAGASVKELLGNLPNDCISKQDNGKFICLHYNNGTCKRQKSSSCNMGVHICYKKGCGKKRPYIECSH